MQSEAGERDFSHHLDTGVRAFVCVCFINLLNSCQVTPIFPSQRKCVASLRRGESLKKISFPSYLFTSLSPPLSPTQSRQFSSASSALISRILACVTFLLFFLFPVRGEGKDEAQLVAAISARRFAVYRSQTTPCALQRPQKS